MEPYVAPAVPRRQTIRTNPQIVSAKLQRRGGSAAVRSARDPPAAGVRRRRIGETTRIMRAIEQSPGRGTRCARVPDCSGYSSTRMSRAPINSLRKRSITFSPHHDIGEMGFSPGHETRRNWRCRTRRTRHQPAQRNALVIGTGQTHRRR